MEQAVIDRSTFAELQDTAGAEFVAELVQTFVQEAPGMLAELRSARADSHAERFRRAAHSLKSNANTFGATRLAALARELELGGPSADPLRDQAALTESESDCARAATALEALCHG
jgi:histidine phosphotransfer protein HptB